MLKERQLVLQADHKLLMSYCMVAERSPVLGMLGLDLLDKKTICSCIDHIHKIMCTKQNGSTDTFIFMHADLIFYCLSTSMLGQHNTTYQYQSTRILG